MAKQIVKMYATIQKFDEENRMVYGYASTEVMDCQGEIIPTSTMQKAFPEYMKYGNIREMHSSEKAAGTVKEYSFDETGTFIGVEVVDDAAWKKVVKGVYKGFSIGGAILKKVGSTISELSLIEISLVDRPANPLAVVTSFGKSADLEDSELLTFAKRFEDNIPDVVEEEANEDEVKKAKLLEDLEKSGLSLEAILALVEKSKKEAEDKEAEEIAKRQEALVAKGFYEIKDVISAVDILSWVLDNEEWESKWNNDANVEILTSLRDHIISITDLAQRMLANEISDIAEAKPEIIELSNKIDGIKKYAETLPKPEPVVEVEVVDIIEEVIEDINKSEVVLGLNKSLTEKDEKILELEAEINTLKELTKGAVFESKSITTEVKKTISNEEIKKSAEEINKDLDKQIEEVKEKLSKCSSVEEAELKSQLGSLRVRKGMMSLMK